MEQKRNTAGFLIWFGVGICAWGIWGLDPLRMFIAGVYGAAVIAIGVMEWGK